MTSTGPLQRRRRARFVGTYSIHITDAQTTTPCFHVFLCLFFLVVKDVKASRYTWPPYAVIMGRTSKALAAWWHVILYFFYYSTFHYTFVHVTDDSHFFSFSYETRYSYITELFSLLSSIFREYLNFIITANRIFFHLTMLIENLITIINYFHYLTLYLTNSNSIVLF